MSGGVMFGNKIVDVVLIACFLAQLYKVFGPVLKGGKIQPIKFFHTGGMPSSHASTVLSLVTCIYLTKGFSSLEFAIASVFGSIVLYDATGVRAAAGEHAKALNKLIESIEKKEGIEIIEKKFKEFLGHTRKEVFFGALLGIVVTLLFRNYLL